MTHPKVDLRFSDRHGRQHVVRATLTEADGWHVVSSRDDGRATTHHCGTWQSVERTIVRLRLGAAEPSPHRLVRPLAAALAALIVAGAAAVAYAQAPAPQVALQQFTDATTQYAWMHRRIERAYGPLTVTSDPETIIRVVKRMAETIRAERRDARQGDIFTEAVAPTFRNSIADALTAFELTPADVLAAEAADGVDGERVPLAVNADFPWIFATAMFPCMLEVLPQLPPELQYRIVGRTLVLVDVHASLIVDYLPNALAATELR